jgi:hypothetical protein
VVKVQPAIVVVKSELTTNVGRNCNKESSFKGTELQLLYFNKLTEEFISIILNQF